MRYNHKSNNRIIFELLRDERIILEQHARDKGCTLLLNFYGFVHKKKKSGLLCRLSTMLEFLNKRELQDKIDSGKDKKLRLVEFRKLLQEKIKELSKL
ncbi:hypothetical protein JW935_23255 [candidate division KSB1 bacterium]|nr:hypothetical protein [candidate division KSB1 bacterium]